LAAQKGIWWVSVSEPEIYYWASELAVWTVFEWVGLLGVEMAFWSVVRLESKKVWRKVWPSVERLAHTWVHLRADQTAQHWDRKWVRLRACLWADQTA
jgi:hypothetical protein